MNNDDSNYILEMTDKELRELGSFIYAKLGIKINPSKKTMLQVRLQRRLRVLGIRSYKKYLEYIQTEEGFNSELTQMMDAVTTNTTSFFREAQHFDFLIKDILPLWQKEDSRVYNIWSAGCSSGEEPYTIAMVLSDYNEKTKPLNFKIMATDISTKVLDKAERAVYEKEKIKDIPERFKYKYFLRSKDKSKGLVRIVPELRKKISFSRLNFMHDFQLKEKADLIFCRNVMIYFDKNTQIKLVEKFCRQLKKKGYLFIGHSESLLGSETELKQIAPAIYQKV